MYFIFNFCVKINWLDSVTMLVLSIVRTNTQNYKFSIQSFIQLHRFAIKLIYDVSTMYDTSLNIFFIINILCVIILLMLLFKRKK